MFRQVSPNLRHHTTVSRQCLETLYLAGLGKYCSTNTVNQKIWMTRTYVVCIIISAVLELAPTGLPYLVPYKLVIAIISSICPFQMVYREYYSLFI